MPQAKRKNTTSRNDIRQRNAGYIYKFSREAQVLERVEYIVKTLRGCYIRDDWRMDEHDAARVVQYFRWLAEGQPEPEDDPEWGFVLQWIVSHGQSFDWIFNGDPRCMITTGAWGASIRGELVAEGQPEPEGIKVAV
jgi:hypothetical protein